MKQAGVGEENHSPLNKRSNKHGIGSTLCPQSGDITPSLQAFLIQGYSEWHPEVETFDDLAAIFIQTTSGRLYYIHHYIISLRTFGFLLEKAFS